MRPGSRMQPGSWADCVTGVKPCQVGEGRKAKAGVRDPIRRGPGNYDARLGQRFQPVWGRVIGRCDKMGHLVTFERELGRCLSGSVPQMSGFSQKCLGLTRLCRVLSHPVSANPGKPEKNICPILSQTVRFPFGATADGNSHTFMLTGAHRPRQAATVSKSGKWHLNPWNCTGCHEAPAVGSVGGWIPQTPWKYRDLGGGDGRGFARGGRK